MKKLFRGVATAVTTPFVNGGAIDYDAHARQIEFQIQNGADAIVVCGTTGEASTLSDEERKGLIKFTVEKTARRIPVIAGAGSNDTMHALRLAQMAKECGADAHLQVTPYYNKTSQKGLIKHYLYIADRVDLPMILYNVPSRTGMNIAPSTYAELAKHPHIVGFKEANANIADLIRTLDLCGDDIYAYSGEDQLTLPMLAVGAKGVISVVSNILPAQMHELCDDFFNGDIENSAAMQKRLSGIMQSMFCQPNPIPVKAAQMLMGLNDGSLRMPLTKIDREAMQTVMNEMKKFQLIN